MSDDELRALVRDGPPASPDERAELAAELRRRSEQHKGGMTGASRSGEVAGGNRPAEPPSGRRAVTILVTLAGIIVVAGFCAKAASGPDSAAARPTTTALRTGERYTTSPKAIGCASIPEFKRMVELSGDQEAGLKFLATGRCWILNRPRTVTYESDEGDRIARVREPGEVDSWYMLESQLQP